MTTHNLKNEQNQESQSFPIRINEMILERVQGRLDLGARKYGDTIALSDKRDMIEETLEEVLDAIVYSTCALIQLQYNRHEKKDNSINTEDLTLIMEGLSMVSFKGSEEKDTPKVRKVQSLQDRLTNYANDFYSQNKE
jgi:hypothetical protein